MKNKNNLSGILFFIFSVLHFWVCANEPAQLKWIKNRNQLPQQVLYAAELNNGAVYLGHNTFTYVFYSESDLAKIDEYLHNCDYLNPETGECPLLHGHAYKVHFENSNASAEITEAQKQTEHYNYFFGQDESKWAGDVPLFKEISCRNIYAGIDLKVYSSGTNPKYDFVVHPSANATDIVLIFEATNGLEIQNGNLKIKTSVRDIIEQKPLAYQIISGEKKEVACNFHLDKNKISFRFPNGYNKQFDLIIDPVIIASTYSGTTYRAYAHTAAYDDAGNIYSAGRAFSVNVNGSGAGYPATLGAFQTSHAGGFQDICISKYNPDASLLLWATYIGGSLQEQPHSLVVNANQQLYIYGTSNSANYPVTAGAYQMQNLTDNFGNHLNDIIVTKLNAAGSALIGSTYVGGRTENDGINWSSVQRYYGDYFKGEIVIDSTGNAYVASYTRATDFPATAGTVQPAYSGGYQDGVIFKLNSNMTSLLWATFYGGPAEDACYGLKLDAAGNIFVTGAISSNVLTNTSGTIHPGYIGGLFDAFVTHISANGQTVLKSTYFGSTNEEQAYLLDLDATGNVYIFGATPNSSITATAGAYQGVMNGSYIAKLKPTLDSVYFITTFNQLAPTALMVDECNYIYAVGHGGLNTSIGNLSGFTTTSGAFQTGSGGFYLMTLEPEAVALKFGSYYGPQDSHVDGGTCRFDKKGIIYHALCTDKTTLYTTANAFHTTKLSNDFDNAVFKIDFQAGKVIADALATIPGSNDTSAQISSCVSPMQIQFINHSANAVQYVWYFGNGDSSNVAEPLYTFNTGGSYQVMLVTRNPATCNLADTAYITVSSSGSVSLSTSSTNTTCNSNTGSASVTVTGTGPFTYLWSNSGTGSSISNLASGTYSVTVTASGSCTASASVTVTTSNGVAFTSSSTNTTCGNNNGTASVTATSGTAPFNYSWSNGANSASLNNLSSGTYFVTVTDANSCSATASVVVSASNGISATVTSNKTVMCSGDSARVCAPSGFTSYLWNTGETDSCINAKLAGNYYVTVTDNSNCTAESNHIAVNVYALPPVSIVVNGDTLSSFGAITYQWIFNGTPIPNATDSVYLVTQHGSYTLAVTDTNGCFALSLPVIISSTPPNLPFGEELVHIYPNPAKENFILQTSAPGLEQNLLAELFDVTGRKIFDKKIISAVTEFDISELMRAVYFLKISGKDFSVTKKLVKE